MKNKNTTCLQFCINSMGDGIFEYANTKEGKALVGIYKKWLFVRENQIKEFLTSYFSLFMIQAAIEYLGMPKKRKSVKRFMSSKNYRKLDKKLSQIVTENYTTLIDQLTEEQRRKFEALFE